MMKPTLLVLMNLALAASALAQVSGNRIYGNRYPPNDDYPLAGPAQQPVIVNDSIMLVSAAVLLNAKADSLVVTLGLSQEAKTVKEANAAINGRIGAFRTSLKQVGMTEADSYVDFIAQTKIYDYTVSGANAVQYIKGFEIKKNVIVRMPAAGAFEGMIEAASEQGIFDIVKVEYVHNGTQTVYAELMAAAASVVKQKKEIYLLLSPVEILPAPKLLSESFFAVYPDSRYKEYQAFESSEVNTDYNNTRFVKKEERKSKTFYYDRIEQSRFDLVVNGASPVVGVQYVMRIQVQYDLKRK